MAKKVVLIISLIVALAGAGVFVAGTILGTNASNNIIDFWDPDSFKEGAKGTVAIDLEYLNAIDDSISTYDCYDSTGEEGITIIVTGLKLDKYSAGLYVADKDDEGRLLVDVTVKACPDDTREYVLAFVANYYQSLYEIVKEKPDADPAFVDVCEYLASAEGNKAFDDSMSHLVIDAGHSVNFALLKTVGLIAAIVGALVALVCALSFKLKARTIIIGFAGVLLISICATLIMFRKELATVTSLKQYSEGVYSLKCTSDYKLDEVLEANLTTENELLDWAAGEIYHGLPISMKENLFGCAAFAVTDTDGRHLMGRNTDYPEADCLMIYCDPEEGYESIGMVDLHIVNIGNEEGMIPTDSFIGRAATLAMPYMIVEGMNEAGFGVSILQLEFDEIHQDTGRKDILLNVAVRATLDKCATVDEAVALLDQFDMNTMLGATFHLFMTDKTGKSVVVEWLGDEMHVTEAPACTNFIISDTSFYGEEEGDGRYEVIMEDLDKCGCVASSEEAMGFLADVGYDNKASNGIGTEWSCVYDLDNFTVVMCTDANYDKKLTITKDTFK